MEAICVGLGTGSQAEKDANETAFVELAALRGLEYEVQGEVICVGNGTGSMSQKAANAAAIVALANDRGLSYGNGTCC